MKLIIFYLGIATVLCAPPQEVKPDKPVVPIVRFENEGVNANGSYSWNYETGNNIIAHEQGLVKAGATAEESELDVSGGYEYTDNDGNKVQISYIANKDGFQPQGNVIPTPPPIPPAIVRLLEWLKEHPSEEDEKEANKV